MSGMASRHGMVASAGSMGDGESSVGTGIGRTGWVTEHEKEASVGSIRGDASKSVGTGTGRTGWVMEYECGEVG